MARVLDEQEKKAASLARDLEEQKKESANLDHYDKTLADRLSIVAEGLAGNFIDCALRALLFFVFRMMLLTVLVELLCSSFFE